MQRDLVGDIAVNMALATCEWDRGHDRQRLMLLVRTLLDNKLVDKKVPPQQYLVTIPNFYENINKFDHEAIRRQAQNCPVK